jgi:hypothetical protein
VSANLEEQLVTISGTGMFCPLWFKEKIEEDFRGLNKR